MADPGRQQLKVSAGLDTSGGLDNYSDIEKPHVSLAFAGHVDSGKSTIVGHLLNLLGGISEREMAKHERESEAMGKSSFKFAWVSDRTRAERERGISIESSHRRLDTQRFVCTLVDLPGHRDFVKNATTALAQSDVAVLVVAAGVGEFEASVAKARHLRGIREGGARLHALLAGIMGLRQLIVFVNKMDTVRFEQARFDIVREEVSAMLRRQGMFNLDKVVIIPGSGWAGDNLIAPSDNMMWYRGPTLLQAIEDLDEPLRLFEAPLRIPIDNVYKIGGIGCVLTGRIASGTMSVEEPLWFAGPGGDSDFSCTVKSIEMHHQAFEQALTGDMVGFCVKSDSGANLMQILKRGMVASAAGPEQVSVCEEFVATIQVINHPGELRVGFTPIIDIGTAHVPVKLKEIEWRQKGKQPVEANPQYVKQGFRCRVKLVPEKPLVVETYSAFPSLGRFALRDGPSVVAVGRVDATTNRLGKIQVAGSITKSAAKT